MVSFFFLFSFLRKLCYFGHWNGLWSVQSKAHQLAKQEKIAAHKKMREEEEAEEEVTRKKLLETHRRVSASFSAVTLDS